MQDLELWGGLECSVVRIGDRWRDQVRETGHHDRDGDLALVRALGIRTLRYPVLWERCTPGERQARGWDWHDSRLRQMQGLGINPIVGLLHHGSGPHGTDLLHPGFAAGLAVHAGRVADRYPHVEWWAPLNEPLTTARFSCLYGLWYPHRQDEAAFFRALVNQSQAILLAMRAIRARVARPRFVHTEDVGHTFSTERLRPVAAYINERSWLSLDLLCGRLDRSHPWRMRIEQAGVSSDVLDELATGEATPDQIGVNHYVTSDRFLDHRQGLYPSHMRHADPDNGYVDTEAARVHLSPETMGWGACLQAVWERYGLPVAITEAHLGCIDPREQVCWLMQAWHAAQALRSEGADIRAVTAWALFGLMDWDSMLGQWRNHYEGGAFDVSHSPPRSTLLADAVYHLAHEGRFDHPALLKSGWWEQEERIHEQLRRRAAA